MDLKKALGLLVAEFDRNGVDYAVIGGFALGALGVPRGTVDLDFLVGAQALHKVEAVMLGLGYKKVFASENASQYVSPSGEMGEVDFLHAFRPASLAMLGAARQLRVFGGELPVKVVRPEDLIALKLQAIGNNPDRRLRDGADIEELMRGLKLDWELLKDYFELFGQGGLYSELKAKYGEK